MKNRNFLKNSILTLLPLSLAAVALLGTTNISDKAVEAYEGVALPTTIKLNDTSESNIRKYYSNLNTLSASEKRGNNLLKNLKTILSDGQKYYNYDSGDLVWKMYEITDRDWEKSPASKSSGAYNSTTNTITNYQYQSNKSHSNNPYVRAYYMDRSQENVVQAWGNHNQDGTGINREHLWAKAEGFDGEGAAGARGDPMHLVAANGYANNKHSNYFFAYVDKSKSYEDTKDKFSTLGHNLTGKAKNFPSYTGTVFEPQDCDKGDIARAIFYMAARYNNIAGASSSEETFDADNPNLLLTNDLTKWKSTGYTSSATIPGYMGCVSDLLEWNKLDPVDDYEIHRNNLLFENFTNNRNPFIDFPDWADLIWGNADGSANPTSDSLNGGSHSTTVSNLEISKKPTKLLYNVGESLDLSGMVVTATLSSGATKTLTSTEYTISITGPLKTTDNSVTISYGGKIASFDIAVVSSTSEGDKYSIVMSDYEDVSFETEDGIITGKSSTSSGTDPAYNANGKDLRIYAKGQLELKSNGSNIQKVVFNISSQGLRRLATISVNSGNISYDTQKGTVTWTGNSNDIIFTVGDTATYGSEGPTKAGQLDFLSLDVTLSASKKLVTNIALNTNSLTLEVGERETLIPTISPDDATVKIVSWESLNPEIATVDELGNVVAKTSGSTTVRCNALDESGKYATCSVKVNDPVTLQSLSLTGNYPKEFYLNDDFSVSGMTVTANYSDNSHVVVTDDTVFSGYDLTIAGEQTVTATYGGVSKTYTINVKEVSLDSNQVLFIAAQQGLDNKQAIGSYSQSVVSLSFEKNKGTQPIFYSATRSFRVYTKNTVNLSSSKKITKIEFEATSTNSNTLLPDVGLCNNFVWTGNSNNVSFTVTGDSGQINIVSIKVTYDNQSQDVSVLSSISIGGTYKEEFFKNETFVYDGLIVTAHYLNGSSKQVTGYLVSGPTMSTVGTKNVVVSYTEGNITKTASYEIKVISIVPTSLSLVFSSTFKNEYFVGESFSTDGITAVEHFNDGTSSNHYGSSCTFEGYNLSVPGKQTVTATYGTVSTSYEITVKPCLSVVSSRTQDEVWKLVDNSTTLSEGDQIVLVGVDGSNKYAMSTTQNSNNFRHTSVVIKNNILTMKDDIQKLELCNGSKTGTFALKLLGLDSIKYLNSSSSKSNHLKSDSDITDNSSYSITISENKNAVISSVGENTRNTIMYNSTDDLFSVYLSNANQKAVQIYKLNGPTASVNLMNVITTVQAKLDKECANKSVTKSTWNSIKSAITPFLSDNTSDDFKILMYGIGKSSENEGNLLEDFLARYDAIVARYNYDHFISTTEVTRARLDISNSPLIPSNYLLFVIIIVGVAVAAVGGYAGSKKKHKRSKR